MSRLRPIVFAHPEISEIIVIEFEERQPDGGNNRSQFSDDFYGTIFPALNALWLETAHPPLVLLDYSRIEQLDSPSEAEEALERELLNRVFKFVNVRSGRLCFCDPHENLSGQFRSPVVRDQAQAVAKLAEFRQPILRDDEGHPAARTQAIRDAHFSLVGCPTNDLALVPARLAEHGFQVREPFAVEDFDYVIFCISNTHGPTEGTTNAVASCAGLNILPLAIVLTNYIANDDDSLRDLISLEERELLDRILPADCVNELPLFYDFDPGLVSRLMGRISEHSSPVQCRDFE